MTTGRGGTERAADVVCFGVIAPATLLIVEDLPAWNTGATVNRVDEFISDDAAIVAMLLRRWEVRSALIGTTLGDDPQGRQASQRLRDMGIVGEFPTSPDVRTPYELNISDRSGGRTYFWKRDPEVLATLDRVGRLGEPRLQTSAPGRRRGREHAERLDDRHTTA